MTREKLTSRQRRHLKGLAHGTKVDCQVGRDGLTEALLRSIDETLRARELVKVGLARGAGKKRKQEARELAAALDAELVQVVGFTALLFRRNPEQTRIVFPQ